jgi:hypothetical protein
MPRPSSWFSLSLACSLGCATVPLETAAIPANIESTAPAKTPSEVASTAATVPPDGMTPGGYYEVRLASQNTGQPGPVVHGQFVRYEGEVSEREAVFNDVIVEMRFTGPGAVGVPIVAKVPYLNRLFKNTGTRTGVDFAPSTGEQRVKLGTVERVESVSPEQAVRVVEERSPEGERIATVRTQVVRNGEVVSERMGVEFEVE